MRKKWNNGEGDLGRKRVGDYGRSDMEIGIINTKDVCQ